MCAEVENFDTNKLVFIFVLVGPPIVNVVSSLVYFNDKSAGCGNAPSEGP